MAYIKQASECDCKTCRGSSSSTTESGEIAYGGWSCACPCHKKNNPSTSSEFETVKILNAMANETSGQCEGYGKDHSWKDSYQSLEKKYRELQGELIESRKLACDFEALHAKGETELYKYQHWTPEHTVEEWIVHIQKENEQLRIALAKAKTMGHLD